MNANGGKTALDAPFERNALGMVLPTNPKENLDLISQRAGQNESIDGQRQSS